MIELRYLHKLFFRLLTWKILSSLISLVDRILPHWRKKALSCNFLGHSRAFNLFLKSSGKIKSKILILLFKILRWTYQLTTGTLYYTFHFIHYKNSPSCWSFSIISVWENLPLFLFCEDKFRFLLLLHVVLISFCNRKCGKVHSKGKTTLITAKGRDK